MKNIGKKLLKDIENDLSDNLHEGLTNRFVDSTSKYFMNSTYNELNTEINSKDKILTINNIEYGSFNGFNLKLNKDAISHSLFSLSHVKNQLE